MSNPFERLRAITRWGSTDDDALAIEAAGALASMARDPAGLVVACRRMLAHHPGNGLLWWVCARILGAADPGTAAREAAAAIDADRTGDRLAATLPFLDDDACCAVVGWPRAVDQALAERVDIDVVAVRALGIDTVGALRERHTERHVRVVDAYDLALVPARLVLVPALAIGAATAMVAAGVPDVLAEVRTQTQIWLVGGVGRVLPRRLFDIVVQSCGATADPALAVLDVGGPDRNLPPALVSLERFDRVAGPFGVVRSADAEQRVDCPLPPELLRAID